MNDRTYLFIEWTSTFLKVLSGAYGSGLKVAGACSIDGLPDAAIANALSTMIRSCKSFERVYFLVGRSAVIVRYLTFPSQKRDEVENMVALQLDRNLPYGSHEMYYDFTMYPAGTAGYSRVVLVAISKAECDRMVSVLRDAGIRPDVMSVSAWGMIGAFRKSMLCDDGDALTMVIDYDHHETEFVIMRGNRLLYTRSFPHEEAITHSSRQSEYVRRVMAEIRHALDTLDTASGGGTINRVILGSTLAPLLPNFREQFFHTSKVELLEDENIVREGSEESFACIRANNLSVMPLAGFGDDDDFTPVNLLPPAMKKESRMRETKRERLQLIILSVILAVLIAGSITLQFVRKYRYVKAIEHQIASIDPKARKVANILRKITIIGDITQGQLIPLELITELYRVTPAGMYITELDYDASRGMTIRGFCGQMSQVSDLLLALQQTALFKNAEIKYAKQKSFKGQDQVGYELFCPYIAEREINS